MFTKWKQPRSRLKNLTRIYWYEWKEFGELSSFFGSLFSMSLSLLPLISISCCSFPSFLHSLLPIPFPHIHMADLRSLDYNTTNDLMVPEKYVLNAPSYSRRKETRLNATCHTRFCNTFPVY
ncbi:hypothetical protein HHX47_DHR7000776, partial [Lentinula edodes]